MSQSGASIEAILRLETTPFLESLTKAKSEVNTFRNALSRWGRDSSLVRSGLDNIRNALNMLIPYLRTFGQLTDKTKSFKQFATGLKMMSEAVINLSNVTKSSQVGMIRIKQIIEQWTNAVKNLTLNIRNETVVEEKEVSTLTLLRNAMDGMKSSTASYKAHLEQLRAEQIRMDTSTAQGRSNLALYHQNLKALAMGVEQYNAIGTQAVSKNNSLSQSFNRVSSSASNTSARMSALTTQTSRLGKAMSSLRMVGTMVGSMLAYNFAHKLLVATGETIHAKSEMEGYFKMLKFGQSDVDHFNQVLDETVQQFQRVNKYSLGETIASIGVEFNLTTKEMERAMAVTSMVTSEYLRAGRNANEASLAVKDVLQGQFQRLSRETGVGKEELEEAGWNGDTSDVLSLMDALEKVGKSRHWDVFAEKANSLNDILTISQNRFGEWMADIVNVVQPSIIGAFNSMMSFAQGLSEALSNMWQWLNSGSWSSVATIIGTVSAAVLVGVHSLTAYRTGATLTQVANMGLAKSLTGLIFGIKAEELAERSATQAIGLKILGVDGEKVAEMGLTNAINQAVFTKGLEKTTTEAQTVANELYSDVLVGEATAISLVKDEETGAIVLKQGLTLATGETTTTTIGFTGALGMMIAGEQLAEGETLSLTGALGALTGAFLTSPVGWFALAILGLASAFYVLSGGLDESWEKMKEFHSIMQNTGDEYKKAQSWLADYTEAHKNDTEAVKEANDTYDDYIQKLQSASYWYQHSSKAYEGMEMTMATNSKDILKKYGLTDDQVGEFTGNLSALNLGKQKYYEAEQVLNKQVNDENSNFARDLDLYLGKIKKNGGDIEEASERLAGNYANLAEHSYIANTTDDWWEWAWNSLYAGMDQFWIDWDMFWADPQWGSAIDGFIKGIGSFNGVKGLFDELGLTGDGLVEAWDTFWKDVTSGLSDWQEGAIQFLEPLNQLGDEVNKFLADPIGYLGISFPSDWSIWSLFGLDTVSASDGSSDHPSFLDDLSNILGIDANSIMQFVNDNIVTPFSTGIMNGILNIPIVGDIVGLFSYITNDSIGANEKGRAIATWIGNGITTVIGQIPIVGDLLRLLGLIPSVNPTANSQGHGVGSNIKDGTQNGMGTLGDMIVQEFQDALAGIGKLGQQAYNTAQSWANQLWEGVNSVLQRASPGFFHDQFKAEFGTDIPNAITEASADAYTVGQSYATQLKDGVNSVSASVGLSGMVENYESDAQIVADSSQMMGINTTTAFNEMGMAVNQTTSQMQSNVVSSYSTMDAKQTTLLQNMKTKNTSAYNDMYQKSNQSLLQMRDSTSNITHQMTNAWNLMKDNIVKSAHQLQQQSTAHFNDLSSTIGSFYRKIQNPSNWGAGPSNYRGVRTARHSFSSSNGTAVRGAGPSKYSGANTMTISQLKRKLCPNGDCGTLFDGFNSTDVVDVQAFLNSIQGEHGFGWYGWHHSHYSHIRNTSNKWDTGSPVINLAGGIPTSAKFKVGDFDGHSPKISFSEFEEMARAIFTTIPYKHYYDSSWKGSWLGALQAGACNCSDGADAIIAFASACGYGGGQKVHGTWDGEGHFWAVINGKVFDTTAMQQRGSWTSSAVSGYGPSVRRSNVHDATPSSKGDVHVSVVIEGDVYGISDLNSKIEEGIDKGLQKHFNDSYAVGY